MRAEQRAEGLPLRYDGRWRDRDPAEAPPGVHPVIRLKAPQTGETVIDDLVQGPVRVANEQLDDMVLLRADGTPTYMLSVVVDDHRHGHHPCDPRRRSSDQRLPPDPALSGARLADAAALCAHPADPRARRRQAQQAARRARRSTEYREMGYLPEAMRNYLMRLGWAHGDDEIISTEQAIAWFDIGDVGRSPARFDLAKLPASTPTTCAQRDDATSCRAGAVSCVERGLELDDDARQRLAAGMPGLKQRARRRSSSWPTVPRFYVRARPIPLDAKAAPVLTDELRERHGPARAPLAAARRLDRGGRSRRLCRA